MNWRNDLKRKPKKLVVKIGSQCIAKPEGGIDSKKIKKIVEALVDLHKNSVQVILVCSGAIAAAKALIKNTNNTQSISDLQALSSIGQIELLEAFKKLFAKQGIHLGQLLLTQEDFKNTARYFNLKNTIEKLLGWNCIPIINENDSISFDEITVGDNDQLAAMIAESLSAELLLILSETDGLYSKNPNEPDAFLIESIAYDEDFEKIETIDKSIVGRGGMKTKLQAVRKLTPLGIPVIIAGHQGANPIKEALEENKGSLFHPAPKKWNKRQSRIISRVRSSCSVVVDKGAADAILANRSLLPVGINKVEGRFQRGDVIHILCGKKTIGYGIAENSSTQIRKYLSAGKPKNYQETLLLPTKVFIHKNNLIRKDAQ